LPFNATDHVPIERATFEKTKTEGSPGLDHATAVREHLDAANFKHGTIFGEGRASAGLGGHDHTEARRWGFQATAKHEAVSGGVRMKEEKREMGVPWFEKMQKGGHSGETELTDKDGGIETGVAFLCGKSLCAFLVKHGEGM